MTVNIPKRITPCPIVEALVEIRFEATVHPNVVFGLIYKAIGGNQVPESLPVLQIPEQVRAIDPSFRFKPHYKLNDRQFPILIGPDVLAIACTGAYPGWDFFSKKILEIFLKIQADGIVKSVSRLGLRYVNAFDFNVFPHLQFNIQLGSRSGKELSQTIFRTEIDQEDFKSTLQLSDNALVNNMMGSIIDIDTFQEGNLSDFFETISERINLGHQKEKELFFDLLKPEFLETLHPEY